MKKKYLLIYQSEDSDYFEVERFEDAMSLHEKAGQIEADFLSRLIFSGCVEVEFEYLQSTRTPEGTLNGERVSIMVRNKE